MTSLLSGFCCHIQAEHLPLIEQMPLVVHVKIFLTADLISEFEKK